MKDNEIVTLFWNRDEEAIKQTDVKLTYETIHTFMQKDMDNWSK